MGMHRPLPPLGMEQHLPPGLKTGDIPLPVSKVQNAVFKIQTHDEMMSGTGFFIENQNTFLTNFHVIFHLLFSDSEVGITDAQGNPQGRILGIKAISPLNQDLALLEVEGYTGQVLKLSSSFENINQDYEMLDTLFLLSSEKVLKLSLLDPSFKIPNIIQTSIKRGIDLRGISGGPVLNSQGMVVGILDSGSENLADIINTNAISGFLKSLSEEGSPPFVEWKNSKSYLEDQIIPLLTKNTHIDELFVHNLSKLISPLDHTSSVDKLSLSARARYAPAQHDLFVTFLEENKSLTENTFKEPMESSTLLLLQQSAGQGYIPAQYNLGSAFYNGWFGMDKDIEEAVRWYLKAARQGYEPALLNLVQMILNDESMSEGQKAATSELLEYFVSKGHVKSWYYLGLMHFKGKGTFKQNNQTALFWLHRAAREGVMDAQVYFGALLYNGEAGFVRSPEAALPYFQAAGLQGSTQAQHILKNHYDIE